jgi:2,3-bisphosphoglycerate-dependent phosphoglycerate mutase
MDGILALVRHGESQWNARNVWTGLTNIGLTEKGKQEAAAVAPLLSDIHLDAAFTSELIRAQDTLSIILKTSGQRVPVTHNAALNERDYGIYTGKNKMEIKAQLGEEDFLKLRRGWDYPVPEGESLKQVYARVVPYFDTTIAPLLAAGKHVLVVAHGNSLRALMKKLENVSDDAIAGVELATGELVVYKLDAQGSIISREERKAKA